MLRFQNRRILSKTVCCLIVLCLELVCTEVYSCSPGRTGARRRSARKLTPLVFKQHVPNVPEHSLGASGPPEGRFFRDDARFKNLVPNYNTDIVFKDEEGTGVDRLMSRRCKEKLDILAISVMNMWPGVLLRVTEGFDEDGVHPKTSLHYEGRAVAISTSDRDISKYGMLARLAVDAGFDWVFYESRSHIYCSVKSESTSTSRFSGCFHGSSRVETKTGTKLVQALEEGDEVLSMTSTKDNTLSYSKVIGFLHRDPYLNTTFIQLITSSNRTLLTTPYHLAFTKNRTAHHALDIRVGDSLMTLSKNYTHETADKFDGISTVKSKVYLKRQGVYAPLTESGIIIVDGVVCSCYAVVESHELAHFSFYPLRIINKLAYTNPLVSRIYNWFTDTFICGMFYNFNVNEVSSIHWYARLLCDVTAFCYEALNLF